MTLAPPFYLFEAHGLDPWWQRQGTSSTAGRPKGPTSSTRVVVQGRQTSCCDKLRPTDRTIRRCGLTATGSKCRGQQGGKKGSRDAGDACIRVGRRL